MVTDIVINILGFIITIFAIDLVSGFVHWVEDTFGSEKTPIVGSWIVHPNVIHHDFPTAFTTKTWFQSSWDLLLATILILVTCWALNLLTWHVWLFCFLGANANQLHKYAHLPSKSVPIAIRVLQKLRVLQGAKDHANHHIGDKNEAYCVITPFLNSVLDKIKFWRFLEYISVPFFGAPRRQDLKHIRLLFSR